MDDIIPSWVTFGLLHDNEPVLEVAAIEQNGFLRGTVGPVRVRIVEGGGGGAGGEGAGGGEEVAAGGDGYGGEGAVAAEEREGGEGGSGGGCGG